jgi:ketosteroid isomerase-like protein
VTPNQRQLSRLRCAGCGAAWLTLASSALVERQERCLHCNAPLFFEEPSDENVSTVLRAWQALLSEDLDALLEQHDPEAEIYPATRHLTEHLQPVYRGYAGIRRAIEDCSGEWRVIPDEVQSVNNGVLTLGKLLQKGGKGATHAVAWLFRLRDGKIVSFKGYLDVGDALRDLQLEAAE